MLTPEQRNVHMIILNMDKTIRELMLQRDALATMLPSTVRVRGCKVRSLKEIREVKK